MHLCGAKNTWPHTELHPTPWEQPQTGFATCCSKCRCVVNKILGVSLTTGLSEPCLALKLCLILCELLWNMYCWHPTNESWVSPVLWGSLLFYVFLVVLETVLFVVSAALVQEPIWMQTAAFSVIKRKKAPLKLAFRFTAKNFETCFCCDIFPCCKKL